LCSSATGVSVPPTFSATIADNPMTTTIGALRYKSNRSRRGMYDGKDIRSGNSLSFSMKANKRKFRPNVFTKRVYSEILDEMVRFHLTTSALRSIDKAGGLDNYLLTSKHVTEGEGKVVKKRILAKLKQMEKQANGTAAAGGDATTGHEVDMKTEATS
jgi:large subunit ribosomal protein L28